MSDSLSQHRARMVEIFKQQGYFSKELLEYPKPVFPLIGDDPTRLYSPQYNNEDTDFTGTRRTDTILAWEREQGKILPNTLEWGVNDFYFKHRGFLYYYKEFLELNFKEDYYNRQSDLENPRFTKLAYDINCVDTMPQFMENHLSSGIFSLDDFRELIKANPIGLPPFVEETENFFVFKDVVYKPITYDILNFPTYIGIKNIVQNSKSIYGVNCHDPNHAMFISDDGGVYLADPTKWIIFNNPVYRKYMSTCISLETDEMIKVHPFIHKEHMSDQELIVTRYFAEFYSEECNKPYAIENL